MVVELPRPRAPSVSWLEPVLFAGFCAYLFSYCFEAPVRFVLGMGGLSSLLYARDLWAFLSVGMLFFRALFVHGTIERHIAIPALLLMTHFFLGLWLDVPLFPALFALKIFQGVLYGAAMWPVLYRYRRILIWVMMFIFLASVTGVVLNVILKKLPWEGQFYDTDFGKSTASYQWWSGKDNPRYSGLARVSYSAAMAICMSGLFALLLVRNKLLQVMVGAAGVAGVYWTTSKSPTSMFFLVSLWMVFASSHVRQTAMIRIGKLFVIVCGFLGATLPFLIMFLDLDSPTTPLWLPTGLISLWERFTDMWPRAFDLLDSPLKYVLGGGLGSIGVPQMLGPDVMRFSAADNIFLYAYIDFGIFTFLYSGLLIFYLLRRPFEDRRLHLWVIGMLMTGVGIGLTSNMLEEAIFAVFFGVLIGVALKKAPTLAEEQAAQPKRRGIGRQPRRPARASMGTANA